VIIPHTAVKSDVLRAVIEEFVTREGTDYGQTAFSLESKVAAVLRQLEEKKVFLVFDAESETCDIVSKGSARYRAALTENITEASDEASE
jgi:uncharacterized protein YheU (UPF0270 family)